MARARLMLPTVLVLVSACADVTASINTTAVASEGRDGGGLNRSTATAPDRGDAGAATSSANNGTLGSGYDATPASNGTLGSGYGGSTDGNGTLGSGY